MLNVMSKSSRIRRKVSKIIRPVPEYSWFSEDSTNSRRGEEPIGAALGAYADGR